MFTFYLTTRTSCQNKQKQKPKHKIITVKQDYHRATLNSN